MADFSRREKVNLAGHVLDATKEELTELIRIIDEGSTHQWLYMWATGGTQLIGDVGNVARQGPATPRRVIAYYKAYMIRPADE